jgi:exosome complex component RRP42
MRRKFMKDLRSPSIISEGPFASRRFAGEVGGRFRNSCLYFLMKLGAIFYLPFVSRHFSAIDFCWLRLLHKINTCTMASSSSSLLFSTQLSQSEQDFIRQGCRENCRSDGRTRDEFRSYTIVTGHDATDVDATSMNDTSNSSTPPHQKHHQQQSPPLVLSNGSARLFSSSAGCCNNTHILCSVKAEVVHPAPNEPDKGVVELYVDTLTTAIGSGGSSRAVQRKLQDGWTATLQQLLVEHLVDLSALCIVPGQYVWRLHVDLYLLQCDAGSLLDATSHVMRAALANTLLPSITTTTAAAPANTTTTKTASTVETSSKDANTDLVVDGDVWKARPPPGVERAPILVTVAVLKCKSAATSTTNKGPSLPVHVLIVNATLEEEACAYCLVHVAIVTAADGTKTVCACQKTGRGSLPVPLLPEIIEKALAATGPAVQQYQIQQPSEQQAASSFGLLQEQFAMQ